MKKAKKIANAWTRDGQVYIKVDGQDGPTEIKHKTHLNKFKDALKITEGETLNETINPRTSSEIELSKMVKSVMDFTFDLADPKQYNNRISPDDMNYGNKSSNRPDPEVNVQPNQNQQQSQERMIDIAGSSRV